MPIQRQQHEKQISNSWWTPTWTNSTTNKNLFCYLIKFVFYSMIQKYKFIFMKTNHY